MKNLSILGVTGSIGTQTLNCIRNNNNDFKLIAMSANSDWKKTIEIIKEFYPKYVVLTEQSSYEKVFDFVKAENINTKVLFGMDGLIEISTLDEIQMVVTAIVGMVGLKPTVEAIKSGKDIALANKETLVTGGDIIMPLAKEKGVKILPVDSEHGAIFQCLLGNKKESIEKLIITASGGPFRGKTLEELKNMSVEEALNHPRWKMGKKISIDSSTLVNKGLEVIEAHHLFEIDYDKIDVVVHKESIIHSMVEYIDGSIIAQLAVPDMRLPIDYALNYPNRGSRKIEKLNLSKISTLSFEDPDIEVFKGLSLAYESGRIGGLMPTVYNMANEISVELFLDKKIEYLDIVRYIEESMKKFADKRSVTIESIIDISKEVENFIRNVVG